MPCTRDPEGTSLSHLGWKFHSRDGRGSPRKRVNDENMVFATFFINRAKYTLTRAGFELIQLIVVVGEHQEQQLKLIEIMAVRAIASHHPPALPTLQRIASKCVFQIPISSDCSAWRCSRSIACPSQKVLCVRR